MMKILAASTAALLLLAGGAAAQGTDCTEAPNQMMMTVCADDAFQAADADLNRTYRALRQQISPQGRDALMTAQRAWIAYRDAWCAFESAGTVGGSVHPMVVSFCLESLTRAQTARLSAQLNCQEGDLSCGGQ